jgi:two-component system, response regulator PdtaR
MMPVNKPAIMVVEDELVVAENLRQTLTGMGYEVPCTACRSDEAIGMADECPPDLILMDIRLEGSDLDGIETARQIRARHEIPVVFVTAYADDKTLERVISTGPSAFILKPFNGQELYSAIEMALHSHRMDKAIRKQDAVMFALSFAVESFIRFRRENRPGATAPSGIPGTWIAEILEHIGLAVDASIVSIFRMNVEREGLGGATIEYTWTMPGMPVLQSQLQERPVSLTFTTSLWRVLLSTGNSIAGDIGIFPDEERRFFERCGMVSTAILPLFRSGTLWGFIVFSTDHPHEWSDSEMEALRMGGNIVSAMLE